MDIQGASQAAQQPVLSSGQSGSNESAATERNERVEARDSGSERLEVERSSTGPDVGNRVDISA
ncbi:hypothetical protein [Yunchengibacter salinarum]|uniref:hypothetical protein n=1 Tax=Yunchengibacter salinarum TaxID=3133399 RepID=UPI0035B68FF3